MKKLILLISILALALLVVACAPAEPVVEDEAPPAFPEEEETAPIEEAPAEPTTTMVEITAEGFSPSTLTVAKGTTVEFKNTVSRKSWPASNSHPTHTEYPGSGINKCKLSPETIFDACKSLKEGESFSFTFDEVGTWGFHDHLKPAFTGTITVE